MALRARINGLALCAGIGGLELGIKRAVPDYKTVCYVERDLYAVGVLAARMEEKALCQGPIWDDITTFNGFRWGGVVDCITAGFPCQPFSVAGKRQGLNDKRWIWPQISRIIGEVKPKIVFLENVPGFVSLGLESVLTDLSAMGFDADWCCVPAECVGAPHERERFFLLAYTDSAGLEIKRDSSRHETPQPFFTNDPWWESEPRILRVVDGVPSRVDRIRCLGNAVVPAQAELAWRILTS